VAETAAIPHFDYIVTNEGEVNFPKILTAIRDGQPPAERIIHGEMPDLDSLPFPDRDLFLDEWRRHGYTSDSPEVPFVEELPPPFLTIIAGRGCMYNCSTASLPRRPSSARRCASAARPTSSRR